MTVDKMRGLLSLVSARNLCWEGCRTHAAAGVVDQLSRMPVALNDDTILLSSPTQLPLTVHDAQRRWLRSRSG